MVCFVKSHSSSLAARPVDLFLDEEENHLVAFESVGYIAAGEEITFDYTSTERKFACPFIDHVTGRWVGSPDDLL